MHRVLVIEDHRKLLRSLERGLKTAGYEVEAADTGEAGFYLASTQPFDAVVLDVMLPGRSGLEVLRDLRRAGFGASVLILSARDAVADRVSGLDHGADDYLVKPFAFDELLARLRAMLNRPSRRPRMNVRIGDLELDVAEQRARRCNHDVSLSKHEFRLLEYLARHKNTTVSRAAIARDVWNAAEGVSSNVVDVYVNALRKKLERPEWPRLIHTIRGVGYALHDDTQPPGSASEA